MDSEQISLLVRDYLALMTPGPTLARALEIHAHADLRVIALLQMLERNPVYAHSILKQKILSRKIVQWREEDPKRVDQHRFLTKRVLGLLGKTAVRNLVACFRIARVTHTGLPRKKDETIELDPQKQIPLALKTENFCQDQQWAFSEMGFIGGLHYDWLREVLGFRKAPEDAKTALSEAYEQGFWAAQHAYKLSQLLKKVSHDRYVFAASLLLPIGTGLMSVIHPKGKQTPSWEAVMSEAEKFGKEKSYAADFFEKKTFSMNHCELSSLLAQSTGSLAKVAPALRFALEPWKLIGVDSEQHQLAMILNVARSLAWAGSEAKPGDHLPLQPFQAEWLRSSGVREATLAKTLEALRAQDKKP